MSRINFSHKHYVPFIWYTNYILDWMAGAQPHGCWPARPAAYSPLVYIFRLTQTIRVVWILEPPGHDMRTIC